MKTCYRCKAEKPLSEFRIDSRGKPGYCKQCWREYQAEYRSAHRAEQRAAKKKWEAAHPEEVRAAKRRRYAQANERHKANQREWRKNNPEKIAIRLAANRIKAKEEGRYAFYAHGITKAQRENLSTSQEDTCAICGVSLIGRTRQSVCIDHDHESGLIRGLLCGKCNAGLGWYERKAAAIADYLAQTPASKIGLEIVSRRSRQRPSE